MANNSSITNQTGVPSFQYPAVTPDGKFTTSWIQFLINLWQRTGGATPTGHVTSVSVTPTDGITASVDNPTSTPNITIGINSSEVTAKINIFTTTSSGTVPASGGLTEFLRGDGDWISLGSAAFEDIGTSGANVPLLNGTNIWSGSQNFATSVLTAVSAILITPILGDATASSLTFSPETNGILGNTTGINTTTGYVGEYISSTIIISSAISLSNAVAANIVILSLSAGDWDISGNIVYSPIGTAVVSSTVTAINTISAMLPTLPGAGGVNSWVGNLTGSDFAQVSGMTRLSSSSAITVYLIAESSFTGSCSAYGFLGARRAV